MVTTKVDQQELAVLDLDKLQKEIGLDAPYQDSSNQLTVQAEEAVRQLLSVDPNDYSDRENSISAVESMAVEVQRKASHRSNMLKQSIEALAKTGNDGGPVAESLVGLRNQVEALDPAGFDFSMSWLRRMVALFPFVGTPVENYFARYQSAGSVLDDIVESLEIGRDQLKRDIITLDDDQQQLHPLIDELKQVISFGQAIDRQLNDKLDNELVSSDPRSGFIQQEVLFPLRQRIIDLQQQLNVSQQAVLTLEVIKRNNKELIRGVSRALGVTINALQVAITLSLALANQRIVLEKIEAVNETTNRIIAQSAEQLKTQGTEIHKQAASAQLSIETLKQSFADIQSAINDIATFRQEALPQMAQSILTMDTMAEQAGEAVQRMEACKKLEQNYGLAIEEQ